MIKHNPISCRLKFGGTSGKAFQKTLRELGDVPVFPFFFFLPLAWNMNVIVEAPAVILDHKVTLRMESKGGGAEQNDGMNLSP